MESPNDCIAGNLADRFADLRDGQATALADGREHQLMLAALLQHEAARFAARLGADHPRVRALQVRASVAADTAVELDIEQELLRVQPPDVDEADALVHGRVTDTPGRGFPGLQVCLIDAAGRALPAVADALTDDSGYYAIMVDAEALKRLAREHPDGLFLAVTGAGGQPLHRTPQPLRLAPGVRLRADVVLDRDRQVPPCPAPPEPRQPPTEPDTVAVPDLRGLLLPEAEKALKEAGLTVGAISPKQDPDQIDRVIAHKPAAGKQVAPGSPVALVVGVRSAEPPAPRSRRRSSG